MVKTCTWLTGLFALAASGRLAVRRAVRNASLAPAAFKLCINSSAGTKSIPDWSIAFAPDSPPSPLRTRLCTCSCVKAFCCAQAPKAQANPTTSKRKVSVLKDLMATSHGCSRPII